MRWLKLAHGLVVVALIAVLIAVVTGAQRNHAVALENAQHYAASRHPLREISVECAQFDSHSDGYLHCAVVLDKQRVILIECPGALTFNKDCKENWWP
jgi:hypothetical protein